jgi:hypothetical protein
MVSRVKVTVYYPAIQHLFDPLGDVGEWMAATGRENSELAKRLVKVRTGILRRSIRWNRGSSALYHSRYTVYTNAYYALFVEKGTRPIITSTTPGKNMIVRPDPHSYYRTPHPRLAVRGQRAQNFMSLSAAIITQRI